MFVTIAALLASAQPVAQPPQPAAEPAKPAKARKVCRADEALSGSRTAKRLCLTEEEWAQRRASMTNSSRSGFSGKAENH